jgi:hypothetical protein
MCNLYSITTNQEAMRRMFRQLNRYVSKPAPFSGGMSRHIAVYLCDSAHGRSSSAASAALH